MDTISRNRRHLFPRSLMIAIAIGGWSVGEFGNAKESVYSVRIQKGSDEYAIQMRYIPPGQLPKEDLGIVTDKSSGTSEENSVDIRPFYISETELTFSQVKSLLPSEAWEEVRDSVQEIKQPPELAKSTESSSSPAFLLHLGDVAAICERLTALESQTEDITDVTIESKSFRIPAYFEWQYACRGVTDIVAAESFPYFYGWVRFDELEIVDQGRIKDAYEQIYQREFKPDNDWGISQRDVLNLCDALAAEGSPGEGVGILNAYLQRAIGIERDFESPTSQLYPAIGGIPNNWGVHRMHGNLSEWTILARDLEETSALWQEILRKGAESSRRCIILAGGGITETLSGEGSWRTFSMRGGVPNQLPPFALVPYGIASAFDRESASRDRYPGIRLVMERVIRNDWFSIVRSSLFLKQEHLDGDKDVAVGFRTSIEDIALEADSVSMYSAVTIYEQLSRLQDAPNESIAEQVYSASIALPDLLQAETDSALEEGLAAIALLDLSGFGASEGRDEGGEEAKPKKPQSTGAYDPDKLYFQLSAEVAALNYGTNVEQ